MNGQDPAFPSPLRGGPSRPKGEPGWGSTHSRTSGATPTRLGFAESALPARGRESEGPSPDFIVLTGFLGSGKTTLLRDYLETDEAAGTAIIVNEVGEIGLDGAILRESGGEVAMTMLANGCICCQLGSDLTLTVEALLAAERPAGAPPLRRIILETSGLSKPGPILRQLASLAAYRMRVMVVATFDARAEAEASDFEEAAAQWAGAHRLVLTKTDMASAERLRSALDEAAAINPLAELVGTPDRREAVRLAFAPSNAPAPVLALPEPRPERGGPHPRISTVLVRQSGPLAYDDLAAWLDNLAGALGERLLRLKGLMTVAESEAPLLVQSVGTLFATPRPFRGPSPGSFLVLIGRDLEEDEIAAVPPSTPFRVSSWRRRGALPRATAGRLRAEAV